MSPEFIPPELGLALVPLLEHLLRQKIGRRSELIALNQPVKLLLALVGFLHPGSSWLWLKMREASGVLELAVSSSSTLTS